MYSAVFAAADTTLLGYRLKIICSEARLRRNGSGQLSVNFARGRPWSGLDLSGRTNEQCRRVTADGLHYFCWTTNECSLHATSSLVKWPPVDTLRVPPRYIQLADRSLMVRLLRTESNTSSNDPCDHLPIPVHSRALRTCVQGCYRFGLYAMWAVCLHEEIWLGCTSPLSLCCLFSVCRSVIKCDINTEFQR